MVQVKNSDCQDRVYSKDTTLYESLEPLYTLPV